ncbi:beta-eliminating lyase-related protein [Aliiroseovarius sp. KMU-50]|uniref:Beta-eliminating lyase-related protein n=1 Tax=Aliiroseovarius salicola TaxID=3009082 RepID=A0ABT4W3W0_9RHOB|nr:beta-eliminating lyase-related protein [Aliiroseovarius sp. KMU-50]MDA5095201.1 beta-eliminating lyase-related protein [Aliiroseovarius sp. KMU-50]
MYFASDNTGPVHPKILEAIGAASNGYAMPYGADDLNAQVTARIRDIFEAPDAAVFLVATGTAANVLSLATLSQPFETIFCTPEAHIHEDECNGPEFFTGGAKLTLVPSINAKMTPETLRTTVTKEGSRGVHGPQRGPVSITNVTERGTVYSVAEIAALTGVAKEFGLATHLDGARFANAVVATGSTPAEMTWKAGIDVVSFGGTKNGCMGVEAVIFFDPKHAWEFELRRKRGAHLFSKHRFLSAQMLAYLEDGLWLDLASRANAANARLARGLKQVEGTSYMFEPEANISFARWSRQGHQFLHDAGAVYLVWNDDLIGNDPDELLEARLVTDWSATDENIDMFLNLIRR